MTWGAQNTALSGDAGVTQHPRMAGGPGWVGRGPGQGRGGDGGGKKLPASAGCAGGSRAGRDIVLLPQGPPGHSGEGFLPQDGGIGLGPDLDRRTAGGWWSAAPQGPCRAFGIAGECASLCCASQDTGSRVREGGNSPVLQGTRARVRVAQHQVMERQRVAGGQRDPPEDVKPGCSALPALPDATSTAVPVVPFQEWVPCPVTQAAESHEAAKIAALGCTESGAGNSHPPGLLLL